MKNESSPYSRETVEKVCSLLMQDESLQFHWIGEEPKKGNTLAEWWYDDTDGMDDAPTDCAYIQLMVSYNRPGHFRLFWREMGENKFYAEDISLKHLEYLIKFIVEELENDR